MPQVIGLIVFYRVHEGVGHANGQVEIGERGRRLFGLDKQQDIGMIHR
jgi:hypothetical protein